jgi:hypothetical protein
MSGGYQGLVHAHQAFLSRCAPVSNAESCPKKIAKIMMIPLKMFV